MLWVKAHAACGSGAAKAGDIVCPVNCEIAAVKDRVGHRCVIVEA